MNKIKNTINSVIPILEDVLFFLKSYNKDNMGFSKRSEDFSKNVAKYLVYKSYFYGDAITNLKLQKLIYYAYVWYLVLKKKKLFNENFQAWPIGPVLPSLYCDLSKNGSTPIDPDYSGIESEENLNDLKKVLGKDVVEVIDEVFDVYGSKTAFELVNLTHSEFPWKNARKGLDVNDISSNKIEDKDIKSFYGDKIKGKE